MTNHVWKGLALLGLGAFLAAGNAGAAEELKVGDKAPDFDLKGSDGKTYKLSDFKGKKGVVLAWFPKASTPGCTVECKSFRANSDAMKAMGAAYFTISVDKPDANEKFARQVDADFPILSDPDKTTANAYGVINPTRGVANRWTFYIDKDGVIRGIDKSVKTATAAEDVIAKVKELKIGKD